MKKHISHSAPVLISLAATIIVLLGSVSELLAQSSKPTGKGAIYGLVADKRTQEPLQSVTVSVFRMQDSAAGAKPVSGALTDKEGGFEIVGLPLGCYRLRIRTFGFVTVTLASLCLTAKEPELEIEKEILLEEEKLSSLKNKISSNLQDTSNQSVSKAVKMNEVSVTAEKQRKVVEAEKTIFNVAQTSLSKGGNAQDVLKTLPSVSVDMEGTVRYRGSEDVQVLVNGRMSMLSLDQIPAETIDRIELVSNPSARFDAEGAGGIINVILKKEREQGFNATAQATAATGDKYNASLEMGFQQTGMAAYLAGGYDAENFWTAGRNVLETRNASSQQRSSVLSQQDSGLDRSRNLWLYGGVILNPDEKTTIEPWIGVVRNHNTNTSTMQYTFRDIAQGTSSLQERTNTRIQATNTVEGGLWTERTFSSQKHKLTLDAYFTRNEALATLAAEQRDVDTVRGSTMQPALLPSDFQRTRLPTLQTSFVGQLDYAQPITGIGGGMLLETGVKITTRRLDNNFTSESATGQAFTTPTEDSRWQIDRDVSNHFVFDERVLAGYATAAGKLGAKNEWTYSAGVRAEITAFASDQRTSGERMARTYWNLFPSASVKYAVSEQESLALGFSRRISRPSAEQLNPFPQFLDPFNLRAGNPFLQPEFTNSLEASYNMVLENGSVNASAYTKQTENLVGEFRRLLQAGGSIATQENLGHGALSGIEASGEYEPSEWLTLTASANGFFKRIETRLKEQLQGAVQEQTIVNSGFGGSVRASARISFGGTEGEIAYSSTFAEPIAQGWMLPYYGWDIAFKQKLFDDKLTLTARIADVFNTRQFGMLVMTETFSQESVTKRESRIAYIGISYRFGSGEEMSVREEKSARHER